MREAVVHVTPGEPRPLDGLCPRCLLPSLVEVDLVTMTEIGVRVVETWIGCTEEDCGEGVAR